MRWVIDALIGALFGGGLMLAGMTRPGKVIGFLDFTGDWDPSLALVMGGALLVHTLVLWATRGRAQPVQAPAFEPLPAARIDARLIGGAALFGAGWGLAGYCPGPALVSTLTSSAGALFVGAMVIGFLVHAALQRVSGGERSAMERG